MSRPVIILVAAILAVLGGVAAWYAWRPLPPLPPPVVAAPAPPPVVPAPAPSVQHPVEDAPIGATAKAAEPVPLDHSDATMRDALTALFAGHALPPFLRVDRIVRNLVAMVDALPRDSVSPTVMPVNPAGGRMAVVQQGDTLSIDAANGARYAPYVDALKAVDTKTAARIYLAYYPLFQQAYRELGYPNGYFNDRLVSVIDLLLATPQVEGPVRLTQPKVLYTFADPSLEALPAGQKILLRIGPENAAVVKSKLREFRAAIVKASPA